MGAIEERTEELKEEAYQYSRDVHSKVDSLFKDVLLESVISEYRNASAQMNVQNGSSLTVHWYSLSPSGVRKSCTVRQCYFSEW